MVEGLYSWYTSLILQLTTFFSFDVLRQLDRFETLLARIQATVLGWFGYHLTFKTYQNGGILVTGAGSGVGAHAAVTLVEKGYLVFAASHESIADSRRLLTHISPEKHANLIPIQLNVTDPLQVEQAFMSISRILEERHLPLIGLVNAVDVRILAPMEAMSQQAWMSLLHVNTIGPFGVIQTFLPLLRKSKGRIVNVSSVSGFTASPMNGGFAASKMAMEAATDALRVEVFRWGISVSLIELGSDNRLSSQTGRGRDGKQNHRRQSLSVPLSSEQTDLYSPLIRSVNGIMNESQGHVLSTRYTTKAISHALLSKHPHTRYLVGMDAKMTSWLRWLCSDRVLDWGYQLLIEQQDIMEHNIRYEQPDSDWESDSSTLSPMSASSSSSNHLRHRNHPLR